MNTNNILSSTKEETEQNSSRLVSKLSNNGRSIEYYKKTITRKGKAFQHYKTIILIIKTSKIRKIYSSFIKK